MKRDAISSAETQLRALLTQRILILDGAMGTMIQRYKLSEEDYRGTRFADFSVPGKEVFVKGNNELLTLTQPQIIQEIHEQYLAAGADLIETNTFGSTSIAQDDYHMAHLVYEMNLQAARIARAACDKYSTPDKPRFVAGALGPTPKTASLSPDVNDPGARNVNFDQLVAAYLEPIVVDEATLAHEAIGEVGPAGHFFGVQHTQDRFRGAFYKPLISDWRNYESWEEAGKPTADQKAKELAQIFLEEYQRPEMDAATYEELDAFRKRRVAEGGVATDF